MQTQIIQQSEAHYSLLFMQQSLVLEKQLVYMIFGNTVQWIVLFERGSMESVMLRLHHGL